MGRLRKGVLVLAVAVAAVASTVAVASAIEGGQTVDSAPWAVQVRADGALCSGTIIAPTWVLTANHCIERDGDPVGVGTVSVRVGSVRLGQGQRARAVRTEAVDDTALIELDREIDTRLMPLADEDPPLGARTTIVGFGQTCGNGEDCEVSPRLKSARNRVVGFEDLGALGPMIMSRAIDGAARSGDSGGPEIFRGRQVGVLCCGTDTVDAYGSVAAHRDWIREVTGV